MAAIFYILLILNSCFNTVFIIWHVYRKNFSQFSTFFIPYSNHRHSIIKLQCQWAYMAWTCNSTDISHVLSPTELCPYVVIHMRRYANHTEVSRLLHFAHFYLRLQHFSYPRSKQTFFRRFAQNSLVLFGGLCMYSYRRRCLNQQQSFDALLPQVVSIMVVLVWHPPSGTNSIFNFITSFYAFYATLNILQFFYSHCSGVYEPS